MFRLIPNWLIVFILLLLASFIAERAKAARPTHITCQQPMGEWA